MNGLETAFGESAAALRPAPRFRAKSVLATARRLQPLQDADEAVNDPIQRCIGNMPSTVADDPFVRREKPVRTNSAALVESAQREIGTFKGDGVRVEFRLAGDLAKNNVITLHGREHRGRAPLRLPKVGEREVQNYDVPSYKSA